MESIRRTGGIVTGGGELQRCIRGNLESVLPEPGFRPGSADARRNRDGVATRRSGL